jgi:hypothetical protein
MEKISLDQILREYASRVQEFEIINSEGAILTIQLAGETFILNFKREKTNVVYEPERVLSFLKGESIIISPMGTEFSLSLNGGWHSMIQKGAEDLLKILEK